MATGEDTKAPDAFRTISEVAEALDVPQHVLRFWEGKFPQIKPLKRAGGRRLYRPDDVALLTGIRVLLYGRGYKIKGVQQILKEKGARHVVEIGGSEMLANGSDIAVSDTVVARVEKARVERARVTRQAGDAPATATLSDPLPVAEALQKAGIDLTEDQRDALIHALHDLMEARTLLADPAGAASEDADG